MKIFSFDKYLTTNISVEEGLVESLLRNCERKHYRKGVFPVYAGDICRFTFFIEKGLLRQYSIDDKGKEHILNFAPEGWFINDRESMYFDQPSRFFIEALEDTEVFLLSEDIACRLDENIPGYSRFNTNLLHNHIRSLQYRIDQLLSATAEERYLSFITMYPNILLRVPQWMVASYLGITPESLSRVRKNLAVR